MSLFVLGLIAYDEQLKQINDHWHEISPYIFWYDHLRSKPERDYISSALRKYYFKDQPISRQTDKVLLQVPRSQISLNFIYLIPTCGSALKLYFYRQSVIDFFIMDSQKQ